MIKIFHNLYQLFWLNYKQNQNKVHLWGERCVRISTAANKMCVLLEKLDWCCITLHLNTYFTITTMNVNLSVTSSDLLALGLTYTLPRVV